MDAIAAPELPPPAAPPPETTLAPMRDTGCRPGDCPARDAAAVARPSAPAPAGGAYNSVDRPPAGAFLRTGADGQTRVETTLPKRLPKLWPPIVLVSVGATLLGSGLTFFTLALIEGDTSEFSTLDGLAPLLVGGGLFGGGIVWLNKRKAKRRQILEESAAPGLAWGHGERGSSGLSFGMQGLGARVRLQM
jgi:hypothetical protein